MEVQKTAAGRLQMAKELVEHGFADTEEIMEFLSTGLFTPRPPRLTLLQRIWGFVGGLFR